MSEILESGGVKYIGVSGGDCKNCCFNNEVCVADLAMDCRCADKDLHWIKSKSEVFTNDETIIAIEQFLEYGEQKFCIDNDKIVKGHGGYFSGGGWAARCLKYHLEELKNNKTT
jgi:hypothetical protein